MSFSLSAELCGALDVKMTAEIRPLSGRRRSPTQPLLIHLSTSVYMWLAQMRQIIILLLLVLIELCARPFIIIHHATMTTVLRDGLRMGDGEWRGWRLKRQHQEIALARIPSPSSFLAAVIRDRDNQPSPLFPSSSPGSDVPRSNAGSQ